MAEDQMEEAIKALRAMKLASETVRNAISSAIPVANNQILTVSVPGTMINYKDFWYNADETIKAPLAVRVAEARLVDGMISLSKFTAGKTGKSVARSYLSTLDLMVPVEASVSGVIGSSTGAVTDQRLKTVQDRYNSAMAYLKSPDDSAGANGRSKLETYVMKEESWSREVQNYTKAQNDYLATIKPGPTATAKQIKEARELYLQWLQEHGRDFKHTIQTKYMDWVVHGYKFMIDFNFGIVDISSGMKRIENSKEAFRNLTLIADDGVSEYSSVVLTPSHWATIVKDKVMNWEQRNNKPTAAEIRAELRRLRNLLSSHEVLQKGIDDKAFFPIIADQKGEGDDDLRRAYAEVYADIDDKNNDKIKGNKPDATSRTNFLNRFPRSAQVDGSAEPKGGDAQPASDSDKTKTDAAKTDATKPDKTETNNPFQRLIDAQAKWTASSLNRNKATARSDTKSHLDEAQLWLKLKIDTLKGEIKTLEGQLGGDEGKIMPMQVVNEKGVTITDEELKANPALMGLPVPKEAEEWTRVSCKASRSSDKKETFTSESASAIAAKVGWGLFSASGGGSHTNSSAKAMSSMSNLDVEITMDCMVVEIERPWLHAELFNDAELDSGSFKISPGAAELKRLYEGDLTPSGPYQQFSSYPTAFVVAADVELSFSGDTTQLESAVSASSTEANLSVGYGPFSISGSHKQSNSHSKSKMESTATGCKISIQAPQIVGWVQTLMPQLPKPTDGSSTMVGLFAK